MFGGIFMENKPYAYRVDGGLLLFGEKGRKLFNKILNTPPRRYNAKKALRNAKKDLRRQGYFV